MLSLIEVDFAAENFGRKLENFDSVSQRQFREAKKGGNSLKWSAYLRRDLRLVDQDIEQ